MNAAKLRAEIGAILLQLEKVSFRVERSAFYGGGENPELRRASANLSLACSHLRDANHLVGELVVDALALTDADREQAKQAAGRA